MQTTGLSAVQAQFRAYGAHFTRACAGSSAVTAASVTAYDKQQHRWDNQTGEAERQIACTVQVTPTTITLVNAHGVPYGVWLEVRWQGRYAILLEALRIFMAPWLERSAAMARAA